MLKSREEIELRPVGLTVHNPNALVQRPTYCTKEIRPTTSKRPLRPFGPFVPFCTKLTGHLGIRENFGDNVGSNVSVTV